MRRVFLRVATVAILSSSMLFTSCIGSFGLTKQFLTWNQSIDTKFVNAVLFVLMSPAYAVTTTADLLVLNSIEFWSGTNPVEAGLVKEVKDSDGQIYTVESLENGYKIESPSGELAYFIYDFDTQIWSSVVDGVETKLLKLDRPDVATVFLHNGEQKEVELSNEGILSFEQYVNENIYLAVY